MRILSNLSNSPSLFDMLGKETQNAMSTTVWICRLLHFVQIPGTYLLNQNNHSLLSLLPDKPNSHNDSFLTNTLVDFAWPLGRLL